MTGPRTLSPEEAASLNNEVVVWGVDEGGQPLGLVPEGSAFANVGPPPSGPWWRWNFEAQAWRQDVPIDVVKAQAMARIDAAAGAARLRYITEVPGQQATYLDKAAEARDYAAAGYAGEVPPLVQAEVSAYADAGEIVTAQEAAESILATSSYWRSTVNPQVERLRLGFKRRVQGSADIAEIDGLTSEAEAALQAL